jgi:ribonuclease HIII
MNPDILDLDTAVRLRWQGDHSSDRLSQVVELAFKASATSLAPLQRALQTIKSASAAPSIVNRLDMLQAKVGQLRKREIQVDRLADADGDPDSVLAVFEEEIETVASLSQAQLRTVFADRSSTRTLAAENLLTALNAANPRTTLAEELRIAIDDLKEREYYESYGLFTSPHSGDGIALGVKLVTDAGSEQLISDADEEMREQGRIAAQLGLQGQHWGARIEWAGGYQGESIGLPLYIAALVARGLIPRQALCASTGKLDINGRVFAVRGVASKIRAAIDVGMRRVIVPLENAEEARQSAQGGIEVIGVSNVLEVTSALREPFDSLQLNNTTIASLIRASLPEFQLILSKQYDDVNGRRMVVGNAKGTATIWVYNNSRVKVDGPKGEVLDACNALLSSRIPAPPENRDPVSFVLLTEDLQARFKQSLANAGAVEELAKTHEHWRLTIRRGRSRASVVLYASTKCVIQGTAPAHDVATESAQIVTRDVGGLPKSGLLQSEPETSSLTFDESQPHIGTDEAGKGDYFGPLVSAAVFVDAESAKLLRQMGVRDSKKMRDSQVREVAKQIRELIPGRFQVTAIHPSRYNQLTEEFRKEGKNLNSLLAWGHASSIRRLLAAPSQRKVKPDFILIDQFGDTKYVDERTHYTEVPIVQRTKAESDVAVAAASVLARDGFLAWLEKWSKRVGMTLPKGASTPVIIAGKAFVQKWGSKWLDQVAKTSFRTTEKILDGEAHAGDEQPNWAEFGAESETES